MPQPNCFLVNGQSNALGSVYYANGDQTVNLTGTTGSDLQSWSGSALVQADGQGQTSISYTDQKVGLIAIVAMRALAADLTIPTVYCINRAIAGKNIAFFLPASADVSYPGGINNYTYMKNNVTSAGVTPRAILWWQGETDVDEGTTSAAYQTSFATLRTNWYVDFPQVNPTNGGYGITLIKIASGATIRSAQDAIAISFSDVKLVTVDDLTGNSTYQNGVHYTFAGYSLVANRFLQKSGLLPNLNQPSPIGIGSFATSSD